MTIEHPDLIVIRGAPGSGKSVTSKALARHFPKGVRVEVDTLRAMVVSVDWTNQKEHINILSLSTELVAGFLQLGYKPVILVDTFSGNKFDSFLLKLRSLLDGLDVRSFALMTVPAVLKIRVENRPMEQFKNHEICQKLNSEVAKNLQPNEHLIDNSALTPEQTAESILLLCRRASKSLSIADFHGQR